MGNSPDIRAASHSVRHDSCAAEKNAAYDERSNLWLVAFGKGALALTVSNVKHSDWQVQQSWTMTELMLN